MIRRRHRHFPICPFCATSAQAGGYWICNTGSDFDPCERKIFAAGATALKSCGPPAALHFPTPGARNRFWRLVTSPRHRLRADIGGNIYSFWIDPTPPLGYGIFIA